MLTFLKVRISTALLVTTIACVSLAWWLDHKSQDKKLRLTEDRYKAALEGAVAVGELRVANRLGEIYQDEADFSLELEWQLVTRVWYMYVYRDNLAVYAELYPTFPDYSGEHFASAILPRINCDDADGYFALLRKHYPYPEEDPWNQLDEDRLAEFRKFIEDCIEKSKKWTYIDIKRF